MKFYGRRRELALLSSAYTAPGSAFIPIYGRRRIGKSELIVHFMAAKPGIYYVGKQAPGMAQLREFLEVAARTLGEPLLAGATVDSWKGALELVFNRWPRGRKLVLALDEFQWMAEASPELPSVLQELWDRSWQQAGKGSYWRTTVHAALMAAFTWSRSITPAPSCMTAFRGSTRSSRIPAGIGMFRVSANSMRLPSMR